LHQSPLQSKGESEDSSRPPTEATPLGIPQVAVPLRAVHSGLDLEFSTAQESEDEGNVEEVNVVVDSPRRSSLPRGAPTSGKEAEVPSEKTAEASSSPEKSTSSSGAKKSGGGDSSSSSDSSSFFVRDADLEAAAMELGAKPTAVRLGGNIVKSLRFESRDRERELLAAAGDSFCFPLMEKDLMGTGLNNILESAQYLSLKAFVAARCAARQLAADDSSKPVVADLEAKVASLEKEKTELQTRLSRSAEEKATLTTELLASADRAVKAEDAAKAAKLLAEDAEKRRDAMQRRLHTFKEAIKTGSEKLQEELPDLLARYGLVAPDMFPEGTDTVGLGSFFQWLRACVAMLDAGAHFHEDISAMVAVRTLSAAVYSLFPSEAGQASVVTKAQLRSLRDSSFRWPGEETVCPETLPALAKNIAVSFMERFFKGEGRALVQREVEWMKVVPLYNVNHLRFFLWKTC